MTFFTAANGHLYAADLVAEIVLPEGASESDWRNHWHREGRVVLRSGVEVTVEYGQLLVLLAAPAYMIPAEPGTVMVSYNGDQDRISRMAVIAWAYSRRGEIVPVTATGVGYLRRSDAVLSPDGSVDNNLAGWPNVDAWGAWAMQEHSLEGDA